MVFKNNIEFICNSKKICIFALINLYDLFSLGYGVMVTLQILVLSFLVRIRVSQQSVK